MVGETLGMRRMELRYVGARRISSYQCSQTAKLVDDLCHVHSARARGEVASDLACSSRPCRRM
jgi:hypothetical protein